MEHLEHSLEHLEHSLEHKKFRKKLGMAAKILGRGSIAIPTRS